MWRSLPIVAVTFLLAACGGRTNAGATPAAKVAPDPARALGALIDAAHRGDGAAAARLLAAGPKPTISELGEGLGTFAGSRPRLLYRAGDWAVAYVSGVRSVEGTREHSAYAAALHLVGGRWRADLTSRVRVEILGPPPGTRAGVRPQLGVELRALIPLVESGLWLDGKELLGKGGGSPTRGTIYGVSDRRVRRGFHVAVAYARDGGHGTAVAWVFRA